jgi:two-component system, chemotaxis family, chemotaxis protein CheY
MLNILVVDDSLIMRRNITKMIESLGHRVVGEAKDGLEAMACMRNLNLIW